MLRPQGKLISIEHVAATHNAKHYQWQRCLAYLTGGRRITRHTEEAMFWAGFKLIWYNKEKIGLINI